MESESLSVQTLCINLGICNIRANLRNKGVSVSIRMEYRLVIFRFFQQGILSVFKSAPLVGIADLGVGEKYVKCLSMLAKMQFRMIYLFVYWYNVVDEDQMFQNLM